MNWVILIVAGLFELLSRHVWEKSGMDATYWFRAFLICLAISMYLLVRATRELPIATAYAVWTGIGAVGTVLLGIIVFKEPATFWRLFFITTLIVSLNRAKK